MPTEGDICRKLVVPKLQAAGWDSDPFSIAEQRTITDGRTRALLISACFSN
jgi:type I restriction enzyme R subunit